MPRTCCCCIPVLGGATIIGVLAILISLAYMTPLVAYQADIDEDLFNPIKENEEHLKWAIEKGCQSMNNSLKLNLTEGDCANFKEMLMDYLGTALLVDLIVAGVYGLICFLMVIGIHCGVRGMMIPYLMVQMLFIIVTIITLLAFTIVLFFMELMMGIVSAAILLIVSFLMVYYWVSVQQAYVELGNRDYMYSPAPQKPYNGSSHYPSAPQSYGPTFAVPRRGYVPGYTHSFYPIAIF